MDMNYLKLGRTASRALRILIAAVLIALSASGVRAAHADDGHPLADVPFDFYRNEVLIQVWIDGAGPYAVMLDTGTDPSTIDLALARRLHLPLASSGSAGDGGGTVPSAYFATTLPEVTVGGLTADKVDALATDLTGLSKAFHRPVLAVLGYSLLRSRIVQIDYPRKRVRFYARPLPAESARRHNTPRHVRLPFRYADYLLLDQLVINRRPAIGGLDTGSDSAFTVTPAAITKLGLKTAFRQARVASGAGFNGRYQSRHGTLPVMRIGSIATPVPKATFWPAGTGHDQEPFDINIGNAFLKDFVLTLDYRNHIVVLDR
jgi:hypothetical protein